MTQREHIIESLCKGPITPMDALLRFGCFRLAARIKELRYLGYSIRTERVQEPARQYARYHLESVPTWLT